MYKREGEREKASYARENAVGVVRARERKR